MEYTCGHWWPNGEGSWQKGGVLVTLPDWNWWAKVRGPRRTATQHGPPCLIKPTHTHTHGHTRLPQSLLFNLALLMTGELGCQKRFAFWALLLDVHAFSTLHIKRQPFQCWHLLSLQQSGNLAASAKLRKACETMNTWYNRGAWSENYVEYPLRTRSISPVFIGGSNCYNWQEHQKYVASHPKTAFPWLKLITTTLSGHLWS